MLRKIRQTMRMFNLDTWLEITPSGFLIRAKYALSWMFVQVEAVVDDPRYVMRARDWPFGSWGYVKTVWLKIDNNWIEPDPEFWIEYLAPGGMKMSAEAPTDLKSVDNSARVPVPDGWFWLQIEPNCEPQT